MHKSANVRKCGAPPEDITRQRQLEATILDRTDTRSAQMKHGLEKGSLTKSEDRQGFK